MLTDARTLAAMVLTDVIVMRRNLGDALAMRLDQAPSARDRALVQEMCYGVMRWYPRLAALADALLNKPLKSGNDDIRCLLLLGLYQMIYMRIPAHAAINETVAGARLLKKPWASGLINGVLREYQRRSAELQVVADGNVVAKTAHPAWLLERLKTAWPENLDAIIDADNQRPPMALRVNRCRTSREHYLGNLLAAGHVAHPIPHTDDGIALGIPIDVKELPGFIDGAVSVQDGAAQLAAPLLDVRPGDRVLDACAAPGGKTAHLLEMQPQLAELVAIDKDGNRAERIRRNLQRLKLQANIIVDDAAHPDNWWNGKPFNRILLDAPCSATGVVRRHPDIKYLRRANDIASLVAVQQCLMEALWPILDSGGMLLYVTCSVLPDENVAQVKWFLGRHTDAIVRPLDVAWGHPCDIGRQILPGENGMDGFYYACLNKD